MIDISRRRPGLNIDEQGNTAIDVWAPFTERAALVLNGTKKISLQKTASGYWHGVSKEIRPGDRYRFELGDGKHYPDPASLSQPEGVHGPSEVIRLNGFDWSDVTWKNPPLSSYIFYELHTGTFTPQGNFAGLEEKLDYLKDLGITAIELMPVAQFPGTRNWGYDGVYPFAVQNSYGGPLGLQRLVDACHRAGLAVVLDVVYNHLGPEGNYLTAYGPYFTSKYKTPWGGAINFDDAYCEGVREFFIENALMWFRDFHVDALRLDAVHAIRDFGPVHILQEIRQYTDRLTEQTGRDYYLIVELDLNDPVYIDPLQKKGYGMNAQWNDEFHHALRVTAGEKRQGYFSDFNGIEHLCKAYQDAYVYDGQYSAHRGKKFGLRSTNEGHQFVVFSQNHDQTGNRMLGERTSTLVSFEMQKLLAGAVMVSPYLPLLFMGEEWSEPNPFLYFVSHTDPELAEAVRRGRREEFAAFHLAGEAPDPMDEKTFRHSGLQWNLLPAEPYKTMHQYYKALIRLRKNNRILSAGRRQVYCACQPENETLGLLRDYEEEQVACLLNFSKKGQSLPLPKAGGPWRLLLDSAAPVWRGPAAAPQEIPATAASSSVVIRPESILVYGSQRPEEGTDYSTLTI